MYGNAEGSVAPAGRERVSVDDGPGQMRSRPVAGACEQSADLLKCQAESKGRGKCVGSRAIRHDGAGPRRPRRRRRR